MFAICWILKASFHQYCLKPGKRKEGKSIYTQTLYCGAYNKETIAKNNWKQNRKAERTAQDDSERVFDRIWKFESLPCSISVVQEGHAQASCQMLSHLELAQSPHRWQSSCLWEHVACLVYGDIAFALALGDEGLHSSSLPRILWGSILSSLHRVLHLLAHPGKANNNLISLQYYLLIKLSWRASSHFESRLNTCRKWTYSGIARCWIDLQWGLIL